MSSEPASLPLDRVADCITFEIVGIDLAGPLFLKSVEKNHQEAARGPLMTERTVSNGVQGKRMTPKVAIPLQNTTPHQQEDSEPRKT
ncbi:hypothetical protein TNCV_4964441 [Trichonephila clavipes]|nr:hypothetical protein TNCV_4964441 [Trichonephila clavipes]